MRNSLCSFRIYRRILNIISSYGFNCTVPCCVCSFFSLLHLLLSCEINYRLQGLIVISLYLFEKWFRGRRRSFLGLFFEVTGSNGCCSLFALHRINVRIYASLEYMYYLFKISWPYIVGTWWVIFRFISYL